MVDGKEIVVDPTCDHVTPSADVDAITVEPLRVSCNQTGAACEAPASQLVAPPVVERVMNSMSPVGRTSRMTCAEFAAVVARSMMPALANVFVFWMPVTRA